jgi:Fe-S-cluster containining protein
MSVSMKFPCKSCGECCRHVRGAPGLDRGDGICVHFDEATRLCQVYEARPMACSVDRAFSNLFQDRISANVYYMVQARACATLLPENADMPQRTEAALREAGLFNEEAVGAQSAQQIITAKITEDAFRHFRLASDGKQAACGMREEAK